MAKQDSIVHYHSETATNVPSAGDIARGELALNLPDKKIFTKDHLDAIVELGAGGSTVVAVHYSHLLAANDTVNTAISTDITNGDVAFGDVIYVASHYIDTEYAGVPKGGAHYIYTSGAADTSGSEISTNSNHLKLIEPIVTPFHFGVVEDATDEKSKVQKFFDYVTTNTEVHCDWSCNVSVGTGLVWDGTNDYKVEGFLRVQATTSSAIPIVLTIKNALEQQFGSIWCYGDGGSTYSTRTCVDLVYLEQCRMAQFDHIHVRMAKRYGLLIDSSITGNNNYIRVGAFMANDCGTGESGVRLVTETLTNSARTGSSGSTAQYTTLTTTNALPAELEADDSFVIVDGTLYRVIAFNGPGKTIDVYPWTDDTQPEASLTWVIGAALKTKGGDSGGLHIDICEVVGSAIAYYAASLYGATMGECSAQSCIVGQLYGTAENSAHIGTNIQRSYCEANTFDIIQATRTRIYVRLVNNVNISLSKCHNITPMRYTGTLGSNHLYIPFKGLDVSLDRLADPDNFAPPQNTSIGNSAGSTNRVLSQGMIVESYINSSTVTLTDDPDYARLTGRTTAILYISGTGTSEEATGTYTIAVEGGYTIDGASTKTITAMKRPMRYEFKLTLTEWATVGNAVVEGAEILSTGEAGGTKFLREDGDGTCSWQSIGGGGDALTTNPLSQFAQTTSLQLKDTISDETGSGALVFATSPTLVTPALGTPASGVATNLTGTATGLTSGITNALKSATTTVDVSAAAAPTSGQVLKATSGTTATWQTIAGGGDALVANPLSQFAQTTSLQLKDTISDETGSGALVFATSPALVTPDLGTPSAGVATNLTGTAASLTAGTATVANGLKSATTTVSVSAATAPTNGQILKATSSTTATWQDESAGGAPEGTAVLSTGESGGTKYLREDGDGTSSWQPVTATVASLNDVTDVTITANSSGETLIWNGSAWINQTLAEAGIQASGSYITASSADTLTNKTFDANGTGNSLSNVDLANDVTGQVGTTNIADEAVTHAKLAHVATSSILGRVTAATGDVETLTAAQVKTLLAIALADISDAGTIASKGFWTGTQATYDGLTPNATTIYFVE